MAKYKVALIGLGRIGWRGFPSNPDAETHLRAIKSHPNLDLCAAIDIDPNVCEEFTRETGIPTWAEGGLPPADIAIICTPPDSHLQYVEGMLESQHLKGIFCEKPLAETVEDAKKIVALCEEKGVSLIVGHQRRYCSAHKAVKKFVKSGVLGDIAVAHCLFTGSYLNNGTHAVDTLRYVAPGAPIVIEPSEVCPFRIHIVGTHGTIELESYKMLSNGYLHAMYDDLIFSMVNGVSPQCSGHDGVEAVRIALGAESDAPA